MLDLFFKKYAWIANAVLLFAAAWLTAKTVNTVVGALLRPRPEVDLASVPAAPPAPQVRAPLLPEKLYGLIGQKPPAPPPTAGDQGQQAQRPQNCAAEGAAPVRTALHAQLVGGTIGERPQWSLASIMDLGTRETRIYAIGDTVLGARVLAIGRLRDEKDATGAGYRMAAIVCNDGRKEFVDFEGGEGAGAGAFGGPVPPIGRAPVPPPAGEGAAEAPNTAEGIKKTAENQYEVKKSVIDGSLSNLNAVATQARIVPSFKNGVANGFKLFSIQPNSLYANIGIENGDVIQRINGYEINSPDKALEVYQKLRTSPHITIEGERNGRPFKKDYNVTDG